MKVSKQIISILKNNGVNFFLSVPCKLLSNMITILEEDKDVYYSAIPREEEGMGICAGAYLGNKFPCIMLQNTGLGNSVNAIVTLLKYYKIPIVLLISYRGTPGEKVLAQFQMGRITKKLLSTMNIPTLHCNKLNDIEKISKYLILAQKKETPVAILCDFNLMKADI